MKLRVYMTSVSLALVTTLVATSFIPQANAYGAKPDDWRVPPKAAKKRNPYPPGPHSTEIGQALYYDECRQCHGQSGLGVESSFSDLDTFEVMTQTDGELFWKIRRGKGEMPGYRRTLSKAEVWHIINYMRSEYQ